MDASVSETERRGTHIAPEDDLEVTEEVPLAEQPAAFGNECGAELEDRPPWLCRPNG
jgi:hypothetical protein